VPLWAYKAIATVEIVGWESEVVGKNITKALLNIKEDLPEAYSQKHREDDSFLPQILYFIPGHAILFAYAYFRAR
jgi:hypothetical protein